MISFRIIFIFLLVATIRTICPMGAYAFDPPPKEEKTAEQINEELGENLRYKDTNIRGWRVRFHGKLLESRILMRKLKDTLTEQLKRTSTRVPGNALNELRKIPIYLYHEKKMDQEGLIAYYDPQLKAVVFHDADKLSDLKDFKNAVVLHELAHGYHHQVLGYSNLNVIDAYEHAKESGKYREVYNIYNNDKVQAYAMENHVEYFAELTETYFSKTTGKFRNDYYPYIKSELKSYDPEGYRMIRAAWRQSD